MESRSRFEVAAAAAATAACIAFVLSLALGLRREATLEVANAPTASVVEETGEMRGRVEVRNASGRAGLARAATDQLRSGGFDVVFFGNAGASEGDSSVVIDRIGRDDVARAAAQHLGITRVRTARDSTLFLDATIIIGKDWPPKSERAVAGKESWGARIKRWVSPGS